MHKTTGLKLVLTMVAAWLAGCAVTVQSDIATRAEGPAALTGTVSEERVPLELKSRSGETLRGWMLVRKGARREVIWFYGANNWARDLGSYALWLSDLLDANVILFDYRGSGSSEGSSTFAGWVEDGVSIYDEVAAHLNPGRLPILVSGHSLGTGVATHVAAQRPVEGLLLFAPMTTMTALAHANTPWILRPFLHAELAGSDYGTSPVKEVSQITVPLLVAHGDADSVIPKEQGEEMFQRAASRRKAFCELPGGKHGFNLDDPKLLGCMADFARALSPGQRASR